MSPDKKFGNIKKDGSYNGMIGELEKHNADMGMSTTLLTTIFKYHM